MHIYIIYTLYINIYIYIYIIFILSSLSTRKLSTVKVNEQKG